MATINNKRVCVDANTKRLLEKASERLSRCLDMDITKTQLVQFAVEKLDEYGWEAFVYEMNEETYGKP